MPSPLSTDLRERVVAAVQEGGSRHGAAERFGVSAASASRWHGQFVRDGDITPKPQGGDQRSHQIEAHADLILALYEDNPEIFLSELCESLAERGVCTSTSSLSRFFQRHAITRKKRQRTQPSRIERT